MPVYSVAGTRINVSTRCMHNVANSQCDGAREVWIRWIIWTKL